MQLLPKHAIAEDYVLLIDHRTKITSISVELLLCGSGVVQLNQANQAVRNEMIYESAADWNRKRDKFTTEAGCLTAQRTSRFAILQTLLTYFYYLKR